MIKKHKIVCILGGFKFVESSKIGHVFFRCVYCDM